MKKAISLAVILALMLSLSACGGNAVPYGFSEESYKQCSAALKLMDKFIDGKLSIDKLAEKMGPIYDKLEDEADRVDAALDKFTASEMKSKDYADTLVISSNTHGALLNIGMFLMAADGDGDWDCQEMRDSMYKRIYPKDE